MTLVTQWPMSSKVNFVNNNNKKILIRCVTQLHPN